MPYLFWVKSPVLDSVNESPKSRVQKHLPIRWSAGGLGTNHMNSKYNLKLYIANTLAYMGRGCNAEEEESKTN